MFEFTSWHASFADFFIKLRHYTVIGKQLFIANDRNRVCWVVLGLLQDGAWTDLVENLSVNSLKGDLLNVTTFNPPLFSLVNTFKLQKGYKQIHNKHFSGILLLNCRGIITAPSHAKLQYSTPPPHGITAHAWGAHIRTSLCFPNGQPPKQAKYMYSI